MNIVLNKIDWQNWLEVKGLKQKTITEYNSYLDKLDLNDFTQNKVIAYIQQYNNPVARAFLNNLLSFIKFGAYSEQIKDNVRKIELPKITGRKKKRIAEVITENEMIDFSNKVKNKRTQLMILISFYGGLRVSELVPTKDNESYAITPYSFNWATWLKEPSKNGILNIVGKGNKQRKVFIPQKVMSKIYQYIKNDVSKKQRKEDPLFNFGERRWKQVLSAESMRILGRHINPHLFRHSCNQWLRRDLKWDGKERQIYLGHEDEATTMKYDHCYPLEEMHKNFNTLV